MVSRFIYLPCPSLQMKSCNSKKKLKRIRKYFQSAKSPDDMLRKTKWPKKKSMEVSITAITLRDSRIPKSQWYHEWWPPSCAKSAGCTLLRCCVHRLVTSLAPERCSKNLSSLSVDPGNFHNKVPQRASENWRYPQYSPIFLLIPSGQSGFLGLKVSVILFSSNSLRDHVETHGHKRAHLVEGYSLGTCGLATHVISRKTHHTLGFRIYKKMLYSLGFINAVMFGGKPYKRRERERETSSLDRTNTHIAAGYWWYFIMSLQVSQISPKIHKTFLVVWTKIPAILPLMTDPSIPFFNLDTALLGLSNFILAAQTPIKKGRSFCVFLVFPLHKNGCFQ